jgi:hypothetical protein
VGLPLSQQIEVGSVQYVNDFHALAPGDLCFKFDIAFLNIDPAQNPRLWKKIVPMGFSAIASCRAHHDVSSFISNHRT